jgi:hypothetical protein
VSGRALRKYAQLVERCVELGRVAIHLVRARREQLVLPVAARETPTPSMRARRAASRSQDRVADDVAVLHGDAEEFPAAGSRFDARGWADARRRPDRALPDRGSARVTDAQGRARSVADPETSSSSDRAAVSPLGIMEPI